MLKNIPNLGNTLNKAEQKEISGGQLVIRFPDDNGRCNPQIQCLYKFDQCTSILSCNCEDPSLNHYSYDLC